MTIKKCKTCNKRLKCAGCGAVATGGTRQPTSYNQFIKNAMSSEQIKAMPKEARMKAAAALWKSQKQAPASLS